MFTLIEDICKFLESKDIAYSLQMRHDMDVICAKVPGSGVERLILPVGISAATISEATAEADRTAGCLYLMKGLEKYPVIITEDRWRRSREMMEARLLAHLEVFDRIYARNCEVRKLDRKTAADFLEANHSYGDAACRYRYGLFLKRHTGHVAAGGIETTKYPKGTLVGVATFSNARKWTKGDKVIRSYEWTRFASLPGVRLSGGMGKLMQAFIDEVQPDDIMTYADLEWSEGSVYRQLGFRHEDIKSPVSFAIDREKWYRTPIKTDNEVQGYLYFRNFGSNKYRLKLTDYR